MTGNPDRAPVTGSAEVLVKPATDNYRQRHGVIVECRDAIQQEQVYEQVRQLGLPCRVVTV